MQIFQKKINMKLIFLYLFSVSLIGCAGPQKIVLPSALDKPDSEIAILRMDPDVKSTGYLNAAILLNGFGREVVLQSKGFHDYTEIKLVPGTYEILMKAYGGYQQMPAFPRVRLKVDAGKIYLFSTIPIMDGSAARVQYRVAGHGEEGNAPETNKKN